MPLPEKLLRSLAHLDQFDRVRFQEAHDSPAELVSVHLNPAKAIYPNAEWLEIFPEPPLNIKAPVAWAPDAFYLLSRPSFTLDPLFHAGTYYVQEASGMFLAHILKTTSDLSRKLKVLDLCAAPGGKSTMIQSLLSADSVLVSNEVIKNRVPALYQNITKWGLPNAIVSNNDAHHFKKLPDFFDILLIDAPCSGSGLFRKDPEAIKTWSEDLVNLCSQRQYRIISDAWDCLKEDGLLIYSTCSYSKEENEDIIDKLMQDFSCESLALPLNADWNIVESVTGSGASVYRFYPDKLAGEGFFISVIRKTAPTGSNPDDRSQAGRKTNRHAGSDKKLDLLIAQWIGSESYTTLLIGDSIHSMPASMALEFETLRNALYLKKAGVRIGKAGEKELIPDHELALSTIVNDAVDSLDLSKENALSFLRGQPFDPGESGKGWRLAKYFGQPMGWLKMIDKRMNNYYPKSWRIRQ